MQRLFPGSPPARRADGVVFALLLTLLFSIAACAPAPPGVSGPSPSPAVAASPSPSFPLTVADFQGRSVTIAKRPERIVSIGPSNTEFLFALGAGERVVAVDTFSDEPAGAKAKDKVGGAFDLNVEKVIALKPDLVVSLQISRGAPLEKIAGQGIAVLIVDPQGIPDAARTAILLGDAVGADGRTLARSIDDGIAAVKAKAATVKKKRVYHEIDASDPNKIFTVGPGSFIHDLMEIAGGVNVAARAGTAYPQVSPEEIIRGDPEVIVFASSGLTPEQIAARPGWGGITAVRTRRIVRVDGNLMHRPGPRLALAAETYFKLVSETP